MRRKLFGYQQLLSLLLSLTLTLTMICRIQRSSRAACTAWHTARPWQRLRGTIKRSAAPFKLILVTSLARLAASATSTCTACAIYEPVCAVQEMQSESRASVQEHGRNVDVDDLLDDPELERLHAERLATMQREAEKRAQLQRKGHGEYQEARL